MNMWPFKKPTKEALELKIIALQSELDAISELMKLAESLPTHWLSRFTELKIKIEMLKHKIRMME